jgi:hypothetical protein
MGLAQRLGVEARLEDLLLSPGAKRALFIMTRKTPEVVADPRGFIAKTSYTALSEGLVFPTTNSTKLGL